MRNWDEMAAPWLAEEQQMEAAHRPVLDALLAKAAPQAGQAVLDIGMGSGSSTLHLSEMVGPGGRLKALDVAPPFVQRATQRLPDWVEVVEGDAETYDFSGAGFDVVVSLFGTMFFADTTQAFANIRRATRPGGRLALSCWAPPQVNAWFSIPGQVAAAVLGPPAAPPDPSAPGPFRFADPSVAQEALSGAGWTDVTIDTIELFLTPGGSPDDVAATMCQVSPAAMRIRAEAPGDDAVAERIRAGLVKALAEFQDADGAVRVPARIHVISAISA